MKDNRLLPIGWTERGPDPSLNGRFLDATLPEGRRTSDPDYATARGTDRITYRITLPPGVDPAHVTVQATLYYQAIPPYYPQRPVQGRAGRRRDQAALLPDVEPEARRDARGELEASTGLDERDRRADHRPGLAMTSRRGESRRMRRFGVVITLAITVLAVASPARAFTCPVHIQQAEDLIKKAEAKVTAETRGLVDEAKKMLAEAKAHHENAKAKRDHAASVRKAKVAAALAEEAITLQSP